MRMQAEIVWGHAEGRTPLSAFDAALSRAGIHNYNLVTYSSIIPADATVEEVATHDQEFSVGDPVGVVLAENTSDTRNETVAAGLGWALAEEGGIFYEATAESAPKCRERLRAGLEDAREYRDWNWRDAAQFRVCEHTVERTGAAVVAAVYEPLSYERSHD